MTATKAACKVVVAPFMGAWIETVTLNPIISGLKVAPFMGAWIETGRRVLTGPTKRVAPFMGAWIETEKLSRKINVSPASHPSWVRGLKLSEAP